MRKTARSATVLAISATVLAILAVGMYFFRSRPQDDPPGNWIVAYYGPGAMYAEGDIRTGMATDIANHIGERSRKADPVQVMLLNSLGGTNTGGDKINEVLRRHPEIVVWVGETAKCGSSCVDVMADAYSRGRLSISLDACVYFHAGTKEREPDGGNDCKIVEDGGAYLMRPWAMQLSPRLATYFATCNPDPLATIRGIRMDWRQIDAINRGFPGSSCREQQAPKQCETTKPRPCDVSR